MRRSVNSEHFGTISHVRDCGSIVVLMLRAAEGWVTPVFFDHRCFMHLLEGERCDADALIGRRVRVFENKVEFIEEDTNGRTD